MGNVVSGNINGNTAVALFGGFLLLLSGSAVFKNYILPHANEHTLEAIFYGLGALSIMNNKVVGLSSDSSFYLSIPGQLIIPATFLYSLTLRKVEMNQRFISLMGSAFWGTQAVYWQSQLFGVFSAGALVMSLGGFAGAIPGVTFIGIEKDSTSSLVQSSGMLSLAYIMACQYNHLPTYYTNPFKVGMLTVLPLYHYLGNIFLSATEGYGKPEFGPNYVPTNLMTCLSLYGGYVLGNSFGLSHLSGTVKVMTFLYGVEKYYEIPWKDNMVATFVLGLGMVFSPAVLTEYFTGGLSQMKNFPGNPMITSA